MVVEKTMVRESALHLRWIQIQHGGGTDDLLGNF